MNCLDTEPPRGMALKWREHEGESHVGVFALSLTPRLWWPGASTLKKASMSPSGWQFSNLRS